MAGIDLEQVARIVREVAAEEILPRWRNLGAGDVSTKSHAGDLVTVADRAAEAVLARRLAALLPGSRVVGEESAHADPGLLDALAGDAPVWVLDPIDGTRSFTQGLPTFDVMVALVVRGEPVVGCIFAPAEDDLYLGEAGGGVERRQGDGVCQRLPPRPPAPSLAALEGIVSPQYFLNRRLPSPEPLRPRFRGFTRHTCAGHNYARLLRGDSDFLINFSTNPWDHLPGLALVAALGFHARRHDGRPLDPLDRSGGILVAPDAASWHQILDLLVPTGHRPAGNT